MAINNVVIRVDSSAIIGSGHVMRCLNLADRFRSSGTRVVFISRNYPQNMIQLINDRGFECLQLEFSSPEQYANQDISDNYAKWLWVSQQQDADESLAILTKNKINPDLLIVDHYGLGLEWEKCLRLLTCKILVIDDIARHHECDYLLDQNYYANASDRYLEKVPSGCKLFLGVKYALLNKQLEIVKQERTLWLNNHLNVDRKKRVLIFLGGADKNNYTEEILENLIKLENFDKYNFDIVLGKLNLFSLEIKLKYSKFENLVFHIQPDYYFELLMRCDYSIGASGVAQLERLYLQIPSSIVCIAENQLEIFNNLINDKLAVDFFKCGLNGLNNLRALEVDLFDILNLTLESSIGQISLISDENSWINLYITDFIKKLMAMGYEVEHSHTHENIRFNKIVCYLSYSKIVSKCFLNKNRHNLVVHESALPKGKGWSPLSWQILEGINDIPFTLFEANEKIDDGKIYLQKKISFNGNELVDELRFLQAKTTFELILEFITNYEHVIKNAYTQSGEESFYTKRTPENSELDITKSLKEQFNLLRIVDNDKYPAFFHFREDKYVVKIYKENGAIYDDYSS